MKFPSPDSDVHVPDGSDPGAALARVTHLAVGAHQDDLEIMAFPGICDALDTPGAAFGGVVVTNGAGSPRTGRYAAYTDEAMRAVRREEQREAARVGRYAIQVQLGHPSADVKGAGNPAVVADLERLFAGCSPEVVYLHNPLDKHDTHVGVLARCLEALRRLPAARRPRRVLGCEVWRCLEWVPEECKVALDAGRHQDLAQRLIAVFESQVAGGKRYDRAALGRWAANATFHTSHATDRHEGISWAVDLTPLVSGQAAGAGPGEVARDLGVFADAIIGRLRADVDNRIRTMAGAVPP